jgi:hypothetical protein
VIRDMCADCIQLGNSKKWRVCQSEPVIQLTVFRTPFEGRKDTWACEHQ